MASLSTYIRVGKKFAIFVAVIAVLEGLSYLFSPPMHPLQIVSEGKPALYQAMIESGTQYDTIFVGSSLTEEGLDAETFARNFGGTAFNAGIAGSASVSWAADVIREIITKKHPKLIIYGVENFAFDQSAHQPDTQMFRFLNLYRQREQIRRWFTQTIRGRFQLPPAFWDAQARLTDFDRRFTSYTGATLHSSGWVEVHAVANFKIDRSRSDPFVVSPVHSRAMDDIQRLSKESGVPVVFVQYPQSLGQITRGQPRMAEYTDYMRKTVEDRGFVFLNFNEIAFPNSDPNLYYDVNHLNSEGARLFAPLLAAEVGKRCRHQDNAVSCT